MSTALFVVKLLTRDTGKEFGDPVEMSGCFSVPR